MSPVCPFRTIDQSIPTSLILRGRVNPGVGMQDPSNQISNPHMFAQPHHPSSRSDDFGEITPIGLGVPLE
jgi:hypothetical protein